MDARRRMAVLMGGFAASQMLYVAARLRLADHLAARPLTVAELAAESGAREEPLRRIVRALSTFGVFDVTDGTVSNTPLSECLRSAADDSIRDLALLYGEEHYHAMGELLEAVRNGGSAFEHAYRKPHFSYLASNPDAARAYYDTSAAGSEMAARSLARAYDFSDATKIVDVGGGTGHMVRAVLKANPHVTGVLVETAGMAARARSRVQADGLDGRCEIETGDILTSVRAGGDVYILGHVLHALDDHQARRVLAACERVAASQARVLVIERLIPGPGGLAGDAQFAGLSDVVALAVSGGRERTLGEVEALLHQSALEVNRVLGLESGDMVVEATRRR